MTPDIVSILGRVHGFYALPRSTREASVQSEVARRMHFDAQDASALLRDVAPHTCDVIAAFTLLASPRFGDDAGVTMRRRVYAAAVAEATLEDRLIPGVLECAEPSFAAVAQATPYDYTQREASEVLSFVESSGRGYVWDGSLVLAALVASRQLRDLADGPRADVVHRALWQLVEAVSPRQSP